MIELVPKYYLLKKIWNKSLKSFYSVANLVSYFCHVKYDFVSSIWLKISSMLGNKNLSSYKYMSHNILGVVWWHCNGMLQICFIQ